MTKHTITGSDERYDVHDYVVGGERVLGEGPSTELSATPMEPTVPSPPLGLNVSGEAEGQGDRFDLG